MLYHACHCYCFFGFNVSGLAQLAFCIPFSYTALQLAHPYLPHLSFFKAFFILIIFCRIASVFDGSFFFFFFPFSSYCYYSLYVSLPLMVALVEVSGAPLQFPIPFYFVCCSTLSKYFDLMGCCYCPFLSLTRKMFNKINISPKQLKIWQQKWDQHKTEIKSFDFHSFIISYFISFIKKWPCKNWTSNKKKRAYINLTLQLCDLIPLDNNTLTLITTW